jgi:hypothetical protein
MPDSTPPRRYTNAEAAAILSRALERQNGEGGRISHDELLETAREIGVTTDELEAAVIDEVRARAERLVLEEQRARALRGFLRHMAAFGVVNAVLCVIDKKLTGGTWFYWVGLAWAVALALHAAKTFLPAGAQPGASGARLPQPLDLPGPPPPTLGVRKPAATTGSPPVPPGSTVPRA